MVSFFPSRPFLGLVALLSLLLFPYNVLALKFDLPATMGYGAKQERCIRNFVSRGQLVVVTAIVSGSRGDGQMVNMHVCFYSLNLFIKKKGFFSK